MTHALNKLTRIFLALVITVGVGVAISKQDRPRVVHALGGLIVTYPSTPFFNESNIVPGFSITKSITVANSSGLARMVAVKADGVVRTPAGTPTLDDALMLKIRDGATVLYGPVPLKTFLNNTNPNGTSLGIIANGQTKNYAFDVDFPISSGNEFQARRVEFDLHVGAILGSNIVVNEAFIVVDPAHGVDCIPDAQGKINGQCHEWVELFNPTTQDISLKDWSIVDATGNVQKITANKTITANGFALLTKSNSEFARFWANPKSAEVIELGQAIGNGLGNGGDRLRLLNPAGAEVDAISWGSDSYAPHYAGPVLSGHSIERLVPGFDTDTGTDFTDQATPTPGQ
jgi:hypothetical protein